MHAAARTLAVRGSTAGPTRRRRPRKDRRGALPLALGALLAAAAAELTLRRVDGLLPAHLHFHDQLSTGKWRQLEDLVRRGESVEVLLIGSSQMVAALDPTTIVPPPLTAYNAALHRATPDLTARWLTDVVLPRVRPRVVVWGLGSADLNDNGPIHDETLATFLRSPGASSSPARRYLSALRTRYALLRHAKVLLQPRRFARLLRKSATVAGTATYRHLGPRGRSQQYWEREEYWTTPEKLAFLKGKVVSDFAVGGRQIETITRTVQRLRSAGVGVLLIEMPHAQEYQDLLPRGEQDVLRAREALQRIADETGSVLHTPERDELPTDWFNDCVHLNGRGMRGWTAAVRPRVLDLLQQTEAGR